MSANVLFDAPGPKARRRNRIYAAVGTLAVAGLIVYIVLRLNTTGQFAGYMWNLFEYTGIQQRIENGIVSTLEAFALAGVCSLVLATVLAAGRLSDHAPVRWAATAIVEFFRALPLLILIFVLYASVFSPFWALVTGLTLYNGSVQAEVFRAGINAVPRGQAEAAYALGMRKTQVMLTVLVPQAIRSMLPTIISQLVVTLKDTSLGYIITYEELLYAGRLVAANTVTPGGYPYVPVVIVIGAVYIAMCLALSALANWIERRGRRSRKGTPPVPDVLESVVAQSE
ncbi:MULTISPECIES: amino acid ABC transporter permease [Streptomycetaceae]|uniref:Putative glutamate ABC transporter permease protein n=1 Tax=Streptantibioticus cattleyicolor (strain ATCC 35852 / DSM 46488 / JCM 4925 / NBRC 14057 / NRRL 8057) TaxID=1003195 RepID=F8JUS8_STREN|nr:amino acid ABC transporter permease [Streptantibioticus cattleyicolor]AEW96910.1 putative glutamate ABC transporter permease protein [Streptantibioticus cattleyicolor NRRL 8057 = DSM 46488]MYS61387.1 ABC transporter permease subunit [Streptomyces sp. SID5468]CCB77239.1 putative glutamate ABC transporter permease protein [Streptantibioticus cattleyicolor NRRL 8057 = DSM 46488]